jgi:pimeloyl-ACP methyl ester carboxylesterase
VLAFDRITAPGARPDRSVLFLHGILGRGSNWRTFAKRLVAERSGWSAVLPDLREHGASRGMAPPHTVARAASDLDPVAAQLAKDGVPVRLVLGHSFGGKVALAWAAPGHDTIVVDSTPGPRPDHRGSEGTVAAVEILDEVGRRGPYRTREEIVRALTTAGEAPATAQFLATNFERDEAGRYALALDLEAIRALLDDYFAVDLWPAVETPPADTRVTLIAGGASNVLSPEDLARAGRAASGQPGRVALHVVPGAGHWVHVDAPDALHALVLGALPD